jgi:hypothetical protein
MSAGRGARERTFIMTRVGCTLAAAMIATAAYAQANETSMFGTWDFVQATPAPWSREEDGPALRAEGKRMLGTEVTFARGQVKSKFKPFDCKSKVIYTPNSIEVDALFQGNLPEPNPAAAAARLGFPRGDIPGMDVRCLKALHTFHFKDRDTAMINFNRVIYTLKRR